MRSASFQIGRLPPRTLPLKQPLLAGGLVFGHLIVHPGMPGQPLVDLRTMGVEHIDFLRDYVIDGDGDIGMMRVGALGLGMFDREKIQLKKIDLG